MRTGIGHIVVFPDGGLVWRVLCVRTGLLVGIEALGDVVGIGAIEGVLEFGLHCPHSYAKNGIIETAETNKVPLSIEVGLPRAGTIY